MNSLNRLIAEAQVLAGGEHQCAVLGHVWKSIGGRQCPRSNQDWHGRCSQTVYQCESCGYTDCGEVGGPSHRECMTEGPCDPSCDPD